MKTKKLQFSNIIWFSILGLLLLAACSPKVSEADVAELGQYLATWANMHCTTIWIDEAPINIEDGNAGGCSAVWWQHPEGVAFAEQGEEMPEAIRSGAELWHRKNIAVKTHLTTLLNQSNCDWVQLLQNASRFDQETSQQDVASQLMCLGDVSFVPVERGIE